MWIDFGDVFSFYLLFTDFLLSVYLIRVFLLLVAFHTQILGYGVKEKNIM